MKNLLLGVFYYGVLTPVGAFLRMTRDPLAIRTGRRSDSYWIV